MTRQRRIMPQPTRIPWSAKLQVCGVVGLVLAACQAGAQYDPNWTKNFRVGALTGLGIKGQIKLRGTFNSNTSNPGAGIYDDGYVRTDDSGNDGGYTTYWGYQNGSQYDADTHTLAMHSSSSFTADGRSDMEQKFTAGIEVAYGNNLRQWDRLRLGWEFGFGYLPIALKSTDSISGTVTRTTYIFDTGSIIVPGAPYFGGSSGFGQPSIPANYLSTSSDTTSATISDLGNLDASLFTFRLGPTLFYDLTPNIGLAGGIGPAFGVLSETLRYDETITYGDGTTGRAKGHFGTTDLVYGAYLNLIATYHADENGDVYLGVQYMPMTGSTFSKDGREASINLTGQVYIMLGVNWIF